MADWDIKSSKYLIDNPWIKVRRDDTEVKGKILDYYIVELTNDVIVGGLTEKEELLFVKMYRPGIKKATIELPAGYKDKGKSYKQTALDELEEETGHKAGKIKKIGEFYRSPARMTQVTRAYLATDLEWVGQSLEIDEEELEIIPIDLKKAVKMIEKGEIKDMATIATMLMIKNYLES